MKKSPVIGIYCITEQATGKKYVGQSRNIKRRWSTHLQRFSPQTHDYEILEECSLKELDEVERRYIKELDTRYPNGFNKTVGGNTWDYIYTEEMLQARAKVTSELWQDPDYRQNMSESNSCVTGKYWSPERLAESSTFHSERTNTPEWKQQQSEKLKAAWADEEHRKNWEEGHARRWLRQEEHDAQSERMKLRFAHPAAKEKISEYVTQSWQDPEVRQRHIEGSLRRWSSEEARQEQSRKLIEANANPALRAAKSQALKEYWSDPQKREEHSQRLRGRPKQRVECPHCRTSIAVTVAKRWHFDNCKKK